MPCESQSFIHQVRILSSVIVTHLLTSHTGVAILYSSSQNSLLWTAEVSNGAVSNDYCVAILYSSSQNSLHKRAEIKKFSRSSASRNPLFIKSEFSQSEKTRAETCQGKRKVAILYSSSQNSLGICPRGVSAPRGRPPSRNPLFIKSEFSREYGKRKEKTETDMSQSFIHQVRILS